MAKPTFEQWTQTVRAKAPNVSYDQIRSEYEKRYGTYTPTRGPDYTDFKAEVLKRAPGTDNDAIQEAYSKRYGVGAGTDVYNSLGRGVTNLASQVGQAISYMGGNPDVMGTLLQPVPGVGLLAKTALQTSGASNALDQYGRRIEQAWKGVGSTFPQARDVTGYGDILNKDWSPNWEAITNPNFYAGQLPETLTSQAPVLGAAALGGPLAAGLVGGSMEGLQTFAQSRDEGQSNPRLRGLGMGIGSTALNALPFMGNTGGLVRRTLAGMLKEGATETAEEPLDAALRGKDPVEALRKGMNVFPLAALSGAGNSMVSSNRQIRAEKANEGLAQAQDYLFANDAKAGIEAALQVIQNKNPNMPRTRVVESHKDLPDHIRPHVNPKADGVQVGDTAYLIADQIPSIDRAMEILDHETAHLVMNEDRNLWGPIEDDVQRLRTKDPTIKKIAKTVDDLYADESVRAQETLAKLAEISPKHPLVNKFVQGARGVLRTNGFDLKTTKGDILEMLKKGKDNLPFHPAVEKPVLIQSQPATVDEALTQAPKTLSHFKKVGEAIQQKLGAKFVLPPPGHEIKGRERLQKKVSTDYAGDATQATDVVRGSFLVDDMLQAEAVVSELRKQGMINDKGWRATPAGYADRSVLVQMPGGQVTEVQAVPSELFQAKIGKGHTLYEEIRNLEQKDGTPKPGQEAKLADLYQQSMDFYDQEAWSKLPDSWSSLANMAVQSFSDMMYALKNKSATDAGTQPLPRTSFSPDVGVPESPNVNRAGTPSASSKSVLPGGGNSRLGNITTTSSTTDTIAQGIVPDTLEKHTVTTARGSKVEVQPTVVDASSLLTSADTGYDQNIQPRERANRAASNTQIDEIAQNLDPDLLGRSAEADRGAPVVGPDGQVESGNGRVLAIRRAYEKYPKQAQAYRDFLQGLGVDTQGMKQPVLVRQRTTELSPDQRRQFAIESNESATAALSSPEQAKIDAGRLDAASLSRLAPGSAITSAANRDFVRAFLSQLPASEQNALVTANGELSREGAARIEAAVLAKAYGGSDLANLTLTRALESLDDNVKSITGAMLDAAPAFAQLREAIQAGKIEPKADLTPALVEAVERVSQMRQQRKNIAEELNQGELFGGPESDVDTFIRLFYNKELTRAAGRKPIAQALESYVNSVSNLMRLDQQGMFEDPTEASHLLKATALHEGTQPLLSIPVYQGTTAEPFQHFDNTKLGSGMLARPGAPEWGNRGWGHYFTTTKDMADYYRQGLAKETGKKGNLVSAELPHNPEDFLNWDKPFSEQSPKIQKILKDNFPRNIYQWQDPADGIWQDSTGEYIYKEAGMRSGWDHYPTSSKKLFDVGIPGISYLSDGTTDNYVVFDGKDVSVKLWQDIPKEGEKTPDRIESGGGSFNANIQGQGKPGKFSSLTSDAVVLMQQIGNDFDAEVAVHRRGKRTWSETEVAAVQRLADATGLPLKELVDRKIGNAANAEQLESYAMLVARAAEAAQAKAQELRNNMTDDGMLEFKRMMDELALLQAPFAGYVAEAGRALNIMRKISKTATTAAELADIYEEGMPDLRDLVKKVADQTDASETSTKAREDWNPSLWDKFYEYWINALLSGPTTHVVNMTSNALFNALETVNTFVGAGISRIAGDRSKAQGGGLRATEAWIRLKAIHDGSVMGMKNGVLAYRTEDPQLDVQTKVEFEAKHGRRAIQGKLGRVVRLPGRLLGAEDEFFKGVAYTQELYALGLREALRRSGGNIRQAQDIYPDIAYGWANGTDKDSLAMRKAARDAAQKLTFTNKTGEIMTLLNHWLMKSKVGKLVVPFIRTPTNILKSASKYVPGLNFAMKEVRADLSGVNGVEAKRIAQGRMLTGSGLGIMMAGLVAAGLATGNGPPDRRERALWLQTHQPWSFKVGDQWIKYNRLEPVGMILGVFASLGELKGYMTNHDATEIGQLMMASIVTNLADKTWMRGVSDFIRWYQDPFGQGKRYLPRFLATTAVPTLVSQVAYTQDPYIRAADGLLQSIMARVPGLRENLAKRVDISGEPIMSSAQELGNPFYHSDVKESPLAETLLRLDMKKSAPTKRQFGVELTPHELESYATAIGKARFQVLTPIVQSPQFQAMPETMQRMLLDKQWTQITNQARTAWLMQNLDVVSRQSKARLEKLVPGQ